MLLFSTLKRDLSHGEMNLNQLKKCLTQVDQMITELDLHALAYKQGRLTSHNQYTSSDTLPNRTPATRTHKTQRHLSDSDNCEAIDVIKSLGSTYEQVQRKKYKKSGLGKFSLNALINAICKM